MNYYRAALAAANMGYLSEAMRLVQCSVLLKENAPNASRLLELLSRQNDMDADILKRLRLLAEAGQFKKALKLKLPKTSRAHTIRGLLFANAKNYRRAKEEFALALESDGGNYLAKQALMCCKEKKGGFFDELLRMFGN